MAGTQAKASPCPPAFLESPDPPVRPPTSSPNPENGVWGPGSCKPSHILIQPHLELGGLGEGEVGGGRWQMPKEAGVPILLSSWGLAEQGRVHGAQEGPCEDSGSGSCFCWCLVPSALGWFL